jgi:hypothetical protein
MIRKLPNVSVGVGDLIKARFLSKSKSNDYKWFGFVVEVCEHDAFYACFFEDPIPNNKHLFHFREQSIMWIKV